MKKTIITCDKCGEEMSCAKECFETTLDGSDPIIRQYEKHGTYLYLGLRFNLCVRSKVDMGWERELELCPRCAKNLIEQAIKEKL